MRAQLKAGAELDLLSPEEHRRITDEQTDRLLKGMHRVPLIRRESSIVVTDANGNVGAGAFTTVTDGVPGLGIFRAPEGFVFQGHRFAVNSAAYTPTAPLTQGWLAAYRNDFSPSNLVWFLPVSGSTAVLPALLTWSRDAPWLVDGERLLVVGSGLPVGVSIAFSVEGELWPQEAKIPGPAQHLRAGVATTPSV